MAKNSNDRKLIQAPNPGFLQDLASRIKLILRLMGDRRVNIFLKVLPVAALVYLIVVLVRVNRAVARFDKVIDGTESLLGSLKTLAEETTGTVVAARGLIDEGQRVAADVAVISAHVRGAAEGGAGQAMSFFGRVKSFLAIVAGVKTAVTTVRHFMERRRHTADGETEN